MNSEHIDYDYLFLNYYYLFFWYKAKILGVPIVFTDNRCRVAKMWGLYVFLLQKKCMDCTDNALNCKDFQDF